MTYSYDKRYTPVNFKDSNLFKPIKIGSLDLPQRIALAPLTRMRAHADQVPNVDGLAAEYYDQRSKRPGTLIITEATSISAQAGGYPNVPGIYTDKQGKEWGKIFDKIHNNNSFVYVQLWNLGRQGSPAFLKSKGLRFVGPSDGVYKDEDSEKEALDSGNELKGLTTAEVAETVQDYVKAAKLAIENGADGVEIHAANGYLLNQFLDPISNKRTDKYGGSIENRARFTLEVVDALIDAIGADKVGIRLSPFGQFGTMSGNDPLILAQYAYLIGEFEKKAQESPNKRLAFIDLVEPRVVDAMAEEGKFSNTSFSNDFVYSIWKGVIIRSGEYALKNKQGLKDVDANNRTMLAYGRFFISNPDLIDRLEKGLPLNAYDRSTFYSPGPKGYTDYPTYS
ncbi:hypothetical protein ACO0QE_000927 [Hanseniaspora vineae]